MKKILLILFTFLLLNTNALAKEIIYLKCPEIVTENRSKGRYEAFSTKGKEMGRTYAMITILKSSAKIKLHSAMGNYPVKELSIWETRKIVLKDGKYIYEEILNDNIASFVNKRSFFKVDGNWKFSGFEKYKEKKILDGNEKADIAYTIGGRCDVLSKKTYKSIIKKGE